MTPSWYDVLDVDPTATAPEIRAAWRAAITDLDPTDRRFKLRNNAAEVLLDPERRAAHDAELEGSEDAAGSDDVVPAEVAAPERSRVSEAQQRAVSESTVPPERTWRIAQATSVVAKPRRAEAKTAEEKVARKRGRPPLVVLPVVLAVVAVLLLAVSALAIFRGTPGGPSISGGGPPLPSDQEVAQAQSAAEAAVVPIVAFDYRNLDENKASAESFMTPRYRELYDQYFAATVEGNAERTQTVVQAQLLSSGIVRTGPGQVDVLTFINRPTSNIEQTRVFRDQVVLRMVDRGDEWLVDCLITTAGGTCAS